MEDVFKRCDLSRNGSLSQSEFIAATMAAGLFGTETYRDAAFVALDADADGLITAKDVARLLAPGSSAASDVLAEIDAGEGCDRATFDALVKAAAASFGGASEAPPAEPAEPAPGTLRAVAAFARRLGVGAPREASPSSGGR